MKKHDLTALHFLTFWAEWKKAVLAIWNFHCAFPGCIQKAYAIKTTDNYILNQSLTSCIYHEKLVRFMAPGLIEQNSNYKTMQFPKLEEIIKND